MKTGIKKDISIVFIVNVINMLFSIVSNFVLPKYLSIDTYASIKTYQLYMGYIGIFHLGYVDGIYLKYGGKKLNEIDSTEAAKDLSVFRITQCILVILLFGLALFLKDAVFAFFALSILPYNTLMYLKSLYQATGEFSKYGNIMNMSTIMIFVLNMFFVFGLKTDFFLYYLLVYLISYIAIWFIFEIKSDLGRGHFLFFKYAILKENVQNGWLLMLGNLTSVMLTGIDRWFLKFFMDNVAFAMYSFAVTIENMLNVMITPITLTFYNYFCKDSDCYKITKIRNYVMIFSAVIVTSVFPIKFVVELFLTEYVEALMIIYILFATQIFHVIIKAIYVNLYKVRKMQKKYFSKVVLVIAIGVICNMIFYFFARSKEAFAFATLFTAIIWYWISRSDFKDISYTYKECIYPFACLVVFLLCTVSFNAFIGMIVYAVAVALLTVFCMGDVVREVMKQIMKKCKTKE